MTSITKKSGQIAKKLSRFARKTSTQSKEHIKSNLLSRFQSIVAVRLFILEWILLVSVIILLAVIQSMLYRGSYEAPTFVSGGSYSEATLGDITSLNPLFAATASERTASRLLFATLLGVDTTGNLENQLAQSITHDESGKVWTLKLRPHLQWSDGTPITATDVKYTFDVINDPAARTIYGNSFTTTAVEQVDDLTVTFTLRATFVDFPTSLTIPILPAHILSEVPPATLYEHAFSLSPITSGPFLFNYIQQSDTGETFVFAENPRYFRGQPMLSSFQIHTYDTVEDIAAAIANHQVTATAALSSLDTIPANIYQKNSSLSRGAFAFLNTTSPILSNHNIRTAVRFGLDQTTTRSVLGIPLPLDLPITPTQADLTFPAVPSYDPEKAMELILGADTLVQKSGKLYTKDDQPATLTIATIDTGYLADYATAVADDLSTLGFTVNLNIMSATESQIFFTTTIQPRNYDILLYEVDLGLRPDLLPYYHSTQVGSSGYNFSNYQNPTVNDLILATRDTFDTELRRSKYESFLNRWVIDVPAIGLYQSELTYFYNRTTRNFSENSTLVSPTDRFSDILYWASTRTNRFHTP